jgi:signal transduction histidine kinase
VRKPIASRLSLALLVVTIAIAGGSFLALAIGTAVSYGGGDRGSPVLGLVTVVVVAAFSFLGWLIVDRAGNVIGSAFQVMALAAAVSLGTELIIQLAADHAPSSGLFGMDLAERPSPETGALKQVAVGTGLGIELVGWINRLSFLGLVLPIPPIFVLFPTGRPLSTRWRWALRLWVASVLMSVVWAAFKPADVYGAPPAGSLPGIHIDGPFGVHGIDALFEVLATGSVVAGLVAGGLGVASLFVRFRRARGDERAQMKWLVLVGAAAAAIIAVMNVIDALLGDDALSNLIGSIGFVTLVVLLFLGIPLAVAIAVLKYRLYDIDVVIRKTVVFGGLAGFITLVYVGIVVGLGALLGRTDEPNVALSIAATAIVAVAFQPVRERVQRFASRLVYGKRATPYEVLARLSERAAGTFATEDVLPRTARIIAEGMGASRVLVWLRVERELRPGASWPATADAPRAVASPNGDLPALEADRAVPVRLADELLGAITVDKPASEPFTPAEEKLLEDLASQAGLVISNVRLTAELEANIERIQAQADELRASRQRIVAAQDEERRRLERNIHDGAQQHLVALAVKLRLARQTILRDAAKGQELLVALQDEIGRALDTLSSLALGIYPPLLEEQGLAAALAAQYTRTGLPVHLRAELTRRHPIEAEAAVYFSVLEALQNAAKHAAASRIDVRLEEAAGELRFEVRDDGVGFRISNDGAGTGLQGIRDRLAVFGGQAEIESVPGLGTTIRGRVPITELEGAK